MHSRLKPITYGNMHITLVGSQFHSNFKRSFELEHDEDEHAVEIEGVFVVGDGLIISIELNFDSSELYCEKKFNVSSSLMNSDVSLKRNKR
jgi:hypothetical protein